MRIIFLLALGSFTISTEACYTCNPAVIGNDIFDGYASDAITFSYSTDSNGCPLMTVNCTGFGYTFIIINTPADPMTIVSFSLENAAYDPSTTTVTLPCEQYGWGAVVPEYLAIGNKWTCQVQNLGLETTTESGPKTSSQTTRNPACKYCAPAVIGNTTFDGVASMDEQFTYSKDAKGCDVLTITCSGYGNVFISENTPMDPTTILDYILADPDVYSNITVSLACEQYGWGASNPYQSAVDNAFTCQVDSESPPPPTTTRNPACKYCAPAVIGNTTFYGVASMDEQFIYTLDENGCDVLTVVCFGYGNVFILVETPIDPVVVINFALGDGMTLSNITVTLPCNEFGWGGSSPDIQAIDSKFTCQVDSEVPFDSEKQVVIRKRLGANFFKKILGTRKQNATKGRLLPALIHKTI